MSTIKFTQTEIIKAASVFEEINTMKSVSLGAMAKYSKIVSGYMLMLNALVDIGKSKLDNPEKFRLEAIEALSDSTTMLVELIEERTKVSGNDLMELLMVMIETKLDTRVDAMFSKAIEDIQKQTESAN